MQGTTAIPFTLEQRDLLKSFMVSIPKATMNQGVVFMAIQAVRKLTWLEPDRILQATLVDDGKPHVTSLIFEETGIRSECDCPLATPCCHAAGLVLTLELYLPRRPNAPRAPKKENALKKERKQNPPPPDLGPLGSWICEKLDLSLIHI